MLIEMEFADLFGAPRVEKEGEITESSSILESEKGYMTEQISAYDIYAGEEEQLV